MSLHLRLVIGPVVICDIELFATANEEDEAPAQLTGGAGTLDYPNVDVTDDTVTLGFAPRTRTR